MRSNWQSSDEPGDAFGPRCDPFGAQPLRVFVPASHHYRGARMTLGSHQRCVGKSQVHLTPRWVVGDLGPFDLDPCAATDRPWDCARENYTEADDGLSKNWRGMVWLNPPFDRYQVGKWIAKLAVHGNGICLVHARTEAEWFKPIWLHADLIFFRSSRIKFCRPDGTEQPANSGAPPVFAAFGNEAAERLKGSTMHGSFIPGNGMRWNSYGEAA